MAEIVSLREGEPAHELRRRGGGDGVAALCIGAGQGLAAVLDA